MNGSHSLYSNVAGDLRWDLTPSIPTSKIPKQETWKKKISKNPTFYFMIVFFLRDGYRSRRLNQIPGPGLGIRPYGGAELGMEDGFLRPWWFTWPDDDDGCGGGTVTGNDGDDDPWPAKGDNISIPIPEPPRFLTPSSPNPNPSSPSWLAGPGWVEPGSGIGSALEPPCPSPRSSHPFPFFFLFDPFFPLRVLLLPPEEDMARPMRIYAGLPDLVLVK